jgi:protoporphyrinogen oxidase
VKSAPRVVILGGGPAGVGAARELRRLGKAEVVLLERNAHFGGNAGSFEAAGQRLDFGSHRLHPATDARILADVRELLGDELLDRPRHGRIRLLGKWIHFPLKPVDLFLRLDKSFALGSTRDMLAKHLPGRPGEGQSFASVLNANLGATICREFYFPYAVKLWGHDPALLSGIQARKRVSAGSFGKLVRKVLNSVPGFKKPGAGRFYYPRRGYGAISEAYAEEARRLGADLRTESTVTRLAPPEKPGDTWKVTAQNGTSQTTLEADHLWSTIPITILARAMEGGAPREVLAAAEKISYRAMVLIYLELPVDQFTEYDAHYFPGADCRITRLSEPKNYAAQSEPRGSTVLCAELPCSQGDAVWKMSDAALGELVLQDLAGAGIPAPVKPTSVFTRRLPQAYPVYLQGYEEPFGVLDAWSESLPNAVTYGRQGLFAHDNTHHALYMAYAAAECLDGQGFDRARWAGYREQFKAHVVED